MPDTTTTTNDSEETTESIGSYITDEELEAYIKGSTEVDSNKIAQSVVEIVSTKTRGIEALPYQFMETVDRRIFNTEVGRKYGERIFGRLPLLFLTPCEPLFMDDFSKSSKDNALSALLSNSQIEGNLNDLINSSGKYYSVDFNYTEYYNYLNTMLACIAVYLGIYDTKIAIGDNEAKAIGKIDWSNELNSSFKTFFTCKENIVFYLDGMDTVTESFSNNTTESSLASTVNGYSETIKELRYLFGSGGNAAAEILNAGSSISDSIVNNLHSNFISDLAGGIVNGLANKGVNTILNGGKIIFPELWSDSEFARSYSIDIKLRSPDHDNLSIFLNILKPYCKLLALALPRAKAGEDSSLDPNSYYSPFLVKAFSKGLFNIDMGIITGMSVSKGATCCWNDDGLPTQIDISLEIKDLYSHMAMSSIEYGFKSISAIQSVVNNTAYMDFLANMAGLNIAQMEVGRRITMAYYLSRTMIATGASATFNRFDQGISKLIGKMYKIL